MSEDRESDNAAAPVMRYSTSNQAETWRKFKLRLQYYLEGKFSRNQLTNERKTGTLLTCLGQKGIGILECFNLPEKPDSYAELLVLFDGHFNPRKNIVYERFEFNQIIQKSGQRVNEFILSLKTQAMSCEFLERDNMIRDRLVVGVVDAELRRELLRQSDLTLEKATQYCYAYESSKNQSAKMSSIPASVSTPSPLDALNTTTRVGSNTSKTVTQSNRDVFNRSTSTRNRSDNQVSNIRKIIYR